MAPERNCLTYHTQQRSSLSCLLSACVTFECIQTLKQDHWSCAQRWQQSYMPPVKVPVTSAGKWCTAGALETDSPKKEQQELKRERPAEKRNDLHHSTWQNVSPNNCYYNKEYRDTRQYIMKTYQKSSLLVCLYQLCEKTDVSLQINMINLWRIKHLDTKMLRPFCFMIPPLPFQLPIGLFDIYLSIFSMGKGEWFFTDCSKIWQTNTGASKKKKVLSLALQNERSSLSLVRGFKVTSLSILALRYLQVAISLLFSKITVFIFLITSPS